MVPIEALQMALQKEKESAVFYQRMAADHPAIKELFTE